MQTFAVMARVHVAQSDLDATIAFYERLLGETCGARFPIPELGIEIAAVGNVHLVAGSPDGLAPFSDVRATFFVDSVGEFSDALERAGAQILRPSQQGPMGKFMIARHPDGLVVEYADNVTAAPPA